MNIEEQMIPLDVGMINLQDAPVDSDIRMYIETQLKGPEMKRWSNNPKMRKKITDTLMKDAAGMHVFLYF